MEPRVDANKHKCNPFEFDGFDGLMPLSFNCGEHAIIRQNPEGNK